MAAISEIYFALLLLNRNVNLSGNQVSDTGPSWPSCLLEKDRFSERSKNNFELLPHESVSIPIKNQSAGIGLPCFRIGLLESTHFLTKSMMAIILLNRALSYGISTVSSNLII